MKKAKFVQKPSNLADYFFQIKEFGIKAEPYEVEKTIELDAKEYKSFINDFLDDREWIIKNNDLMWNENEVWHCILVKCEGKNDAILIESEGYGYARYVAAIKLN